MKPSYPNLIRKLLQSKIVMSLKQIRHEIPDRPRSSLFRDLKKVELLTSYSHAGQHHALKSRVKFNPNGLWFYEQIYFSKYGTLKNTLVKIISNSPAGMTHKELKTLLRIQVQNSLTHLIKTNLLQRRLSSEHVFVYLSHDGSLVQEQWKKRLELNEKALSVTLVWSSFGSWLRTIRPGICPSEMVTAMAMRNTFSIFLVSCHEYPGFTKFFAEHLDFSRADSIKLAG